MDDVNGDNDIAVGGRADNGSAANERGGNDEVPGHLAYLLHMTTRRLRAEAENAAAATPPLQAAQARLLDLIPSGGGRLTDLALKMRISKQGLGQLATSLAQAELVEILPDPADKRAKIIRRTPRR